MHGDHILTSGGNGGVAQRQGKKIHCNLPENGSDHDFCPFWLYIRSCFAKFLSIVRCVCVCVPQIEAFQNRMRTKHKNWKKQQFADTIMVLKKTAMCVVFVDDNFCLISVIDRECILFYQIECLHIE